MHYPMNAATVLILIFLFGFFSDWIAEVMGDNLWALSIILLILYGVMTS
jgi:hypothetical protein